MNESGRGNGADEARRVLIIGAGSTGLALAQGLKKAGIPFVIFEQDHNAIRKRNWSMGLHWALSALRDLVPEELMGNLQMTQVDPHVHTGDADRLPMRNGATGDLIKEIQSSKFYRLRRDKFRALFLQGIPVRWGKCLSGIEYSADGQTVTARFTDGFAETGRILIGCDGPHSVVRSLLVGPENARVTPIDFASTMCFTKHTRDHALFLRAEPHNPLYQVAIHPDGYCAWLSLHDGDDIDHPENWTFFHYISFPEPRDFPNNRSNEALVAHQKELARNFVDPWKSVFEWMPDDHPVWYGKLRNWDPSLPGHQWENHLGRVTLAGDAAHPMTFQRGQGLNHAIMDAFTVHKAIDAFWSSDGSLESRVKAVVDYEAEMIARGGEEVRMSEANTTAVHNWGKIMESPSVKRGMSLETGRD
ncbi:FAD binding domain-containing protein [Aspergillus sp. HF37]|nr:FAD binding domain-containing protein [Aspergillus sp. HF37]